MYPDDIVLAGHENDAAVSSRPSDADRADAGLIPSFEELFERHHSMVFCLLYRILGDREEALDASQEVFLDIYQNMGTFRGDSSLKTWIYRIAINRAYNRCRWWNRRKRRETISLEEHLCADSRLGFANALESNGQSPEDILLLREERQKIESSLQKLPFKQRVALIMRDIEGLTYEEIAENLQVSLGTVKSRIARGREELKRLCNGLLS
jgi:RNA polymerase sigma-70 factor, ECF subfamily